MASLSWNLVPVCSQNWSQFVLRFHASLGHIGLHQTASLTYENSLLPLPASENGGADQVRTDDLLVANEALFQLSYDPMTERAGI